jgi:hypothetical protein
VTVNSGGPRIAVKCERGCRLTVIRMALDSMPLLGGKYSEPEQVSPGLVQTFRARDLATGRPVLVHRISDLSSGEQNSLLKLLLSSLYRSPEVKKSVIDVKEEGEVCYVVTEDVPQCFLLQEWLQFENERPDGLKGGEESIAFNVLDSREGQEDPPAGAPRTSERTWTEWGRSEADDEQQSANRASDEISLPAILSGPPPEAPQSAPMRSIEPLPPEFSSSPPDGSHSAASSSVDVSPVDASLVVENEAKQDTGEILQEVGASERQPQTKFAAFLAAAGGETVMDAPQMEANRGAVGGRRNPEVQRPDRKPPLDEFSRLFADVDQVFPTGNDLNKDAPEPSPEPVPAFASPKSAPAGSAAPAASGWTSAHGIFAGTPAATIPALPTAAQTVLESALAAQAESRKNRRLLIAVILVLLGLAILVALLIVPKHYSGLNLLVQ